MVREEKLELCTWATYIIVGKTAIQLYYHFECEKLQNFVQFDWFFPKPFSLSLLISPPITSHSLFSQFYFSLSASATTILQLCSICLLSSLIFPTVLGSFWKYSSGSKSCSMKISTFHFFIIKLKKGKKMIIRIIFQLNTATKFICIYCKVALPR